MIAFLRFGSNVLRSNQISSASFSSRRDGKIACVVKIESSTNKVKCFFYNEIVKGAKEKLTTKTMRVIHPMMMRR
jgi:hypothetical protein